MKYNIIYADPPWAYNKRTNTDTKFGGGAMGHYDTMSIKDICKLPVENIADENCALLLWVTFPKLQEGLDVMKSWGFDYKTIAFNWIKVNKNNQKPFFGIGYYSASNSEICLLGVKGKMKPASNSVSQVVWEDISEDIIAARDKHSKKPLIVRDRITELFGDIPRVELFARESSDGWDSIGNGIDGKSIQEIIK